MLYLDIIFNTLIDIILFHSLYLSLYFFIFLYCIYFLSKKIQIKSNKSRFILICRLLVLILSIPLFNNNFFKYEKSSVRTQNIGIMIDNSLSVGKILNENAIDIKNYINKVEDWANDNSINLYWYDLDSSINKNNIIFNNATTSFDYIKDISLNKEVDQLLLISDGVINSGFISNDFYDQNNIRIHSIGLGDLDGNQDIGIIDMHLEHLKDSIYLDVSFSAKMNKDKSFVCEIFTDDIALYSDSIRVLNGDYNFDKQFYFQSKLITNNIKIQLTPIGFSDSKTHNNYWEIDLAKNELKDILLITGKLSYNTSFIKSNLKSISNINLKHAVIFDEEFDYSSLLLDDFDGVIFDNFPNDINGYNFFKKIYQNELDIMFFESYNFKSELLKMMLDDIAPQKFYIQSGDHQKKYQLGANFDFISLKSNYNLFCNDCSNLNAINYFSNNSIVELSLSNFYAFLIPNISELSFFMKTKHDNNYIDQYFKYLINKNLNNNSLLDLQLGKNNYSIGEKLLFELNDDIPFDIINRKVFIKDLDRMIIDSIDYNSEANLFFNKNGNFDIYFSFTGTNSEVINSNKKSFYIDKHNIELEGTTQNVELLKNISSNSGGFYTSIDSLDYVFLEQINLNFIEEELKDIYSTLEIFIKEKIFLLMIMLFCLEIYLRKKIGLL